MKILLAVATTAEIAPTIDWLNRPNQGRQHEVSVLITGVGMMATTFSLCEALAKEAYDFVLGAGIAGAFERNIVLGECVIVAGESNGDLWAEDHNVFLDVFDIGLQDRNDFPFEHGRLINILEGIPFDISHLRKVSAITVNTVSGNSATIERRIKLYSAQLESMEGAALHYVCLRMNKPFLQLRAVSNYVTPRDRNSWEIGKALESLNLQLMKWLGN